jgi:hypothetical protein
VLDDSAARAKWNWTAGRRFRLGPGHFFWPRTTTGRVHISRAVGSEDADLLLHPRSRDGAECTTLADP